MDRKIDQIRNELLAVRNEREAINAAHSDQIMRDQQRLEFLQNKLQQVQQKMIMPHEAKRALDRIYNNSGSSSSQHRRPLQCIVRREAVLIATMRTTQILDNAKVTTRSTGDVVRRGMICELCTIENERMMLWVDFHRTRNTILAEKKAITDRCTAILQRQQLMIEELDPSSASVGTTPSTSISPKKISFFESIVASTSPSMSKLLYGASPMSHLSNGASPVNLFKSTSHVLQIMPRTA